MEEQVPGFSIEKKEKSSLMKLLSILLFFNKSFMTKYATTAYPKIYVPTFWGKHKRTQLMELEMLIHEFVHLSDRKKYGHLFNIIYLAPQIFSLLALAALWNPWFLLALGFLLPWPSPGRAWLEYRGYRMSIAFYYWTRGKKCNMNWVARQFTGPNYYFMFPFKKYIIKRLESDLKNIEKDDIPNDMRKIKDIIKKRF
tara:strand:+ start:116 stop:709 length:594 start_codon:yes stop_codon:yes gene_type:complete